MKPFAALLILAPAAAAAPAQISYQAGTPGNPPTAPSPTTQGWAQTLSGACSVADVSPDPDFPLNAWQVNDPVRGCAGGPWTPSPVAPASTASQWTWSSRDPSARTTAVPR